MGRRFEVGPRLYSQSLAAAVATLSLSPIADRALIVRRIAVTNVSANDNWTVVVGGREIMRFRVLTTGNQRLLNLPTAGASGATQAYRPNFFDWCRNVLGIDPSFPVPLGLTVTIASVGGATGNIVIESYEVDPADANVIGLNHYKGNVFLVPLYFFLGAAFAGAAGGQPQLDTQVSPPWMPLIFSNAPIPVNWLIELLAIFTEGGGVNTFSGAANHQSATLDLRVFKDQVQLFTRGAPGVPNPGLGIPNIGAASAAGSANTVIGQAAAPYPPFEQGGDNADSILETPIKLAGGEALQLLHDFTGDGTGGASYANFLQVAVARVTVPQSSAGGL